MRPIEPTDAAALVRFHAHLSDRTIQLRYFNLHPNLAPDEVAHLTCVDGFNRVAYVVEHDGEIIAVGRYDRLEDPCRAEVAFVVADEFQHHGLGTDALGAVGRDRQGAPGSASSVPSFSPRTPPCSPSSTARASRSTQNRIGDVVELTMEIGPRL